MDTWKRIEKITGLLNLACFSRNAEKIGELTDRLDLLRRCLEEKNRLITGQLGKIVVKWPAS